MGFLCLRLGFTVSLGFGILILIPVYLDVGLNHLDVLGNFAFSGVSLCFGVFDYRVVVFETIRRDFM